MNCLPWPQTTEQQSLSLQTGKVKLIENRSYWVEASQGLHQAIKAASCVIEPQVGDTVLLFADSESRYYLLSVLTRDAQSPAEMVFDQGLSIKTPDKDLRIDAHQAVVKVERATIVGSSLLSRWDVVRTVARSIEASADRWIQKLVCSYRTVEEFEECKIGRLRYLVKGLFSLKSRKSTINAEETVKIDGSKIMLG